MTKMNTNISSVKFSSLKLPSKREWIIYEYGYTKESLTILMLILFDP